MKNEKFFFGNFFYIFTRYRNGSFLVILFSLIVSTCLVFAFGIIALASQQVKLIRSGAQLQCFEIC